MPITVNGVLDDWTPADRLERLLPGGGDTGVPGYELYGRFEGGTFYIALHSALAISANTTLWLNTDDNIASGTQPFGAPNVGAEFNFNFQTGAFASLFTGAAGQFEVPNALTSGLVWTLSPDGHTLEVAIPKALLGANVDTISIHADVNNDSAAFLPGNYDNGGYRITNPASQQFDGVLDDWTPAQRLEVPATTVAGYEIYGKYEGGDFVFALKSPTLIIGQNTTFWLDTDKNQNTGFQAFGAPGDTGAEFNVNIGQDGVARLYSGDAGQTFVGNIQYHIGADGKTIEFAVPKTLIGGSVTSVSMKADVDNTDFLPGWFGSGKYTVTDQASLTQVTPSDGYRIAIVYSETSANTYFDKMAYSQLFMTAQSQAQAAGIPFDIISETDLTTANLTNLSHYDAIVFPSFRNADSAHYAEIQSVLEDLVFSHNIPLIAAGDFMTNNETGAALSANPYERMVDLLGVNRTGGTLSPSTVNVVAGDNEITAGYGTGNSIHTYTSASTSYFGATNPATATVIATQVVDNVIHNGVVSTVTGGHNVHFATEALLADSNLLGKALDYATAPDTGVQLSLHMSRDESITSSRTDMDQAKELADVNGGIYSAMLPMLQDLKAEYNFVGSYYIDIGLGSLYEDTGPNNTTLLPFYQALLAMGNEIGSHSYTHPENTNLLLPNVLTQTQLDSIRAQYVSLYGSQGAVAGDFTPFSRDVESDPASDPDDVLLVQQMRAMDLNQINTVLAQALAGINNPSSLTQLQQAILDATFQFQFQASKAAIEAQLGISLDGVAIPGMPDSFNTAHSIMQYYNYISGGGSLVGAGYPGAIGYLTPDDTSQVYIGPNVPFDFTLVAFQHHTAAEAQAIWLQYFQDLTKNNDQAIVVWPWHDYAFTQFGPDGAGYTAAMFTAFIAAAYAAGTEFVTGDDLAERIATFDKTKLEYTVTGDTIVAKVTPTINNLGTFALDFDSLGAKHIQSVTGWYAYDDNSVFLDADGGTFTAKLGTTTDDLTHITSIADRAKLMTLTGDGTNLTFTIYGEGKVVIDLKAYPGLVYAVTGATVFSLNGEIMTLDLGAIGSHTVGVSLVVNHAPAGTDAVLPVLEDVPHTFVAADFGFTDVDTNTLSAVKITTLPTAGTLTLGGVAVTLGQIVLAADIGLLVWTPPLNASGNALGALTFQVVDNGGTYGGGVDTDQSPNTITFNVTPLNDAPSGADKAIAILEDAPRAFAAADFGFTDIEGNTLSAVKITTLPTLGTLTLGGIAVVAGQSIAAASLAQLVWTPPLNGNGNALATLTFQVVDNGGVVNGGVDTDQSPNTITFNVTAVNDAPVGTSAALTVVEDTPRAFAAADFGFTDVDSNTLSQVKITTLPTAGTLTLNGSPVLAGALVPAASLGLLVWTPPLNGNGNAVATLTFQVMDNGGTANGGVDLDPTPKTITFNVTSVNDAPSGADKAITILEDAPRTFAAADFGFTDTDGNTLSGVTISTLPTAGTLTLNGVAVTLGQIVPAASLGQLVWTPPLNANGNAVGSFTFAVVDNGGVANGGHATDATPNTITFNVTPVNDAPSGADKALVVVQNTAHTFAAADFGYTDSDFNALSAVKITTLPTAGTLTLNGVAVTLGQSIAAASIGQLVWTPPANATGNGLGSMTFQVVDNGGTANGGVNTDPTPNTITFNVTLANQAPVITSNGGGTTAPIDVNENTTAVTTVTATDANLGDTQTFSISGGADAAKFHINAATGALTFLTAPNFEAPTDSGANNVYDVIVRVADQLGLSNTQAIAVTVKDLPDSPPNSAPVITSNAGGATAAIAIIENTTAVTTVAATDPDVGNTLTYSISGGLDAALFNINANTGVVTFKVAPDYELPTDSGKNNVYDVVVKAADQGGLFDTQSIAITIGNVAGINYVGTAGADTKSGGVEPDTLYGAGGNDALYGQGGNDTLNGGIGNDVLNGGAGNDVFVFGTALNAATNKDVISDFTNATGNNDTIWLDNAIFTKLGAAGALNAAFFRPGGAALDGNDYIVYNQSTGVLSYDADGSGAGSAIQFAVLTTKPALTYQDFVVM